MPSVKFHALWHFLWLIMSFFFKKMKSPILSKFWPFTMLKWRWIDVVKITFSRRRDHIISMLNQYHSLVILCLDDVEVVFLKYLIIQEYQHTWPGYMKYQFQFWIWIPEMQVYFNCFNISGALQRYIKYGLLPDSYF